MEFDVSWQVSAENPLGRSEVKKEERGGQTRISNSIARPYIGLFASCFLAEVALLVCKLKLSPQSYALQKISLW